MATAEKSLLGFAEQGGKGSEVTDDANFKYIYFTEGTMGVNNINLPLDPEIGGGAMLRNIVRAGVSTAGQIAFIPRPKTLASMMAGVLGQAAVQSYGINWDAFGPGWITTNQDYSNNPVTLTTSNRIEVLVVQNTGSITINGKNDSDGAILMQIPSGSGQPKLGTFTSSVDFKKIVNVTISGSAKLKIGIRETGATTYQLSLNSDQFSLSYYTVRFLPGKIWRETFVDTRFIALGLEWAASQFMRGTLTMLGRSPKIDTGSQSLSVTPDNGNPFVGVSGFVEFGGTSLKTVAGNFAIQNQVAMDEEYVIGSYYPESLDIVSRTAAINFITKVDDADLYKKLTYNPGASNEWSEQIMRDGNFVFSMASEPRSAPSTSPFSANAPSGYQNLRNRILIYANMDANKMAWTATPIGLRAQRQITMQMSGLFLADADPIRVQIVTVD
ncbi:MAG: hypothetical protein N2235_23810 [Fischerella sp.]|nr:hypothetical protein [Fischerella sp.]